MALRCAAACGWYRYFWKPAKMRPMSVGVAEVGERVGDGVVVAQLEQRRELLLVELLHALADVVREHEVEEGLLLVA